MQTKVKLRVLNLLNIFLYYPNILLTHTLNLAYAKSVHLCAHAEASAYNNKILECIMRLKLEMHSTMIFDLCTDNILTVLKQSKNVLAANRKICCRLSNCKRKVHSPRMILLFVGI